VQVGVRFGLGYRPRALSGRSELVGRSKRALLDNHRSKSSERVLYPGGVLIGYARVSTLDQNLTLQRDALTAAGCTKLFVEQMSGMVLERPALRDALEFARAGDTIVVWKLDRLAGAFCGGLRWLVRVNVTTSNASPP
jgi:Resolvase, N terminal domain